MNLPLLSPKLDLVFKQLFVKDKSLLLDILNQILTAYKFDPMTKITILNPEILPVVIPNVACITSQNCIANNWNLDKNIPK